MAAKTASLSVNIIADAAKARAGLKEAETAFGKFSREVGSAQGAMGKFQVVSGAAFNAVKAHAVAFATGAATAIGTFVVNSVMGFQKLALEAGKFADATGLSIEEASRFIEVAGDIGVEAGVVEKSINFMNKTLGNSPDLFKQLGVQIEYASNGATDVNGTFLNVIDKLNKIQDPAARAATATQLLGRGWTELAELVGMGAEDLAKALAAVANNKIATEDDGKNARNLRDETDRLKDSWEGFSNTIGKTLIPVLADALSWANKLIVTLDNNLIGGNEAFFAGSFENANKFVGSLDDLFKGLFGLGEETKNTYVVTDQLKQAWIGGYQAMIDARSESDQLAASLRNQAEDADAARLKWDEFRTGLNLQAQTLRIQENIEDFRAKWAGTTEEAKRKSKEYQQELLRIQIELGNAALSIIGLATTAQNTRIRLLIETGRLEQALSLINAIKAGMNQLAGAVTPDRVERVLGQASIPSGTTPKTSAPPPAPKKAAPPPAPPRGGPTISTTRLPHLAAGGKIVGSGMAVVGERGPELLTLPRGASVIPNLPLRGAGANQTIINITVQAGLVSTPDQVGAQIIDAIRRAERRSGQVFASA